MGVLIELDGFAEGRILSGRLKQGHLLMRLPVALSDRFNNGAWVDTLMDVKGNGWDFKGSPLRFSGPIEIGALPLFQLLERCLYLLNGFTREAVVDDLLYLTAVGIELKGRVDVGIVSVFFLSGFLIRLGRYQPNWRIINPPFAFVIVLVDRFLLRLRRLRHLRVSLPSAVNRRSGAGLPQFNPLGARL